MNKLTLFLILLSSGFVACSSTRVRLVEWRNDEMTLCYGDKMSASDWLHASTRYCNGTTNLIGGESRDRLSGYDTNQKDGKNLTLKPRVKEESCRVFQCNGTILPES